MRRFRFCARLQVEVPGEAGPGDYRPRLFFRDVLGGTPASLHEVCQIDEATQMRTFATFIDL